jgi:hypothetical protein
MMKCKLTNVILLLIIASFSTCSGNPTKKTSISDSLKVGNQKIDELNPEAKRIKRLNDIANFIAGLPIDSTSELYSYTLTAEWKTYSNETKAAWDKFKKVSNQAEAWRAKEVPQAGEQFQTLFYPFGGPDFLFANIFFPNAHNYIMIGLESPGSVPQFDASNKKNLKTILGMYKVAIEDVIQLSFFRTNDMKVELTNKAIDGTAPIIMLFLARSGKQIVDVQPMTLDSVGKLTYCDNKIKHNAIGIKFHNQGDTTIRNVYYLSTNLADPALKANKPFTKFLQNIDNNSMSFVKSATYLMHKSYFSTVRNTVLNKSVLLLQDDSGIAYKFFGKGKWNISLYGTYEKPINLFKDFYEPDLFEAFKKDAKPLNFRLGYNEKSALIVVRKNNN